MRLGLLGLALCFLVTNGSAQGTKLWTIGRYDELEKGTIDGVAVRSDGGLEAGPGVSSIFKSGGNYVWAVGTDAKGNVYAGAGGTSAGSASVSRIGVDGKSMKIFESKELGVQTLKVTADGTVYVATSPDGKVYRIASGTSGAVVAFDPAMTEEKPKYLWDLLVTLSGELYVAAGAPAVLYRVPVAGGKPSVVMKTADQHIRCLAQGSDGTVYAGSDGSGVIYRIDRAKDAKRGDAKPFAIYSAPRKEITSLTLDDDGNLYASGIGARGASTLPALPVTGNVGVTVTISQPGMGGVAGANALAPEGTEIYRISREGAAERLLTLKDDVVYALGWRKGELVAASGNRGRVYRIDARQTGRFADIAHLEASQGTSLVASGDGWLIGTSNSGQVYRLREGAGARSTYTSEVFDAQQISRWGRAEVRARGDKGEATGYELYVRGGNVESPLVGWSEWTKVSATDPVAPIPATRYVQWKAVITSGVLQTVGWNYLPKNVAPVVDEIVVAPGTRVTPPSTASQSQTVQVNFPGATSASALSAFTTETGTGSLSAVKDKGSVTVRWEAHDDNGDDLMFAVWYRGEEESNWKLLKDKISERYYSFDASLLPDGPYVVKVVASDAPVHTDADALTGMRESGLFVVDTTPPVPGVLQARLEGAGIHATFEARDATSPIAHAEYSVDAGPWQYLEPAGKVSDALAEKYDFVAPLRVASPESAAGVENAKEHVLAVRVYDRYENMAAVKAVVR